MICSISNYRRIAKDYSSFDGDVRTALVAAQKIVERRTGRFFETDTRTEKLRVYRNGRVYPRAFPVALVTEPTDAVIDGNAVLVNRWGFRDPIVNFNPDLYGVWDRPLVEVTYLGGYAPDEMPEEIVRATAELAKGFLKSAVMDLPAGATSVRQGDLSISGSNLGQTGAIPSSVRSVLRAFKYRDV